MALVTRDQTKAQADNVKTKDVPVPQWGEDSEIRVKALGTGARLRWVLARDHAVSGEDAPDPTALLVVLAAINEDGSAVYTLQDTDWLSELDGNVINRIADAVLEVSGMNDVAASDAEGKSGATQSGDSPTGSPETSA